MSVSISPALRQIVARRLKIDLATLNDAELLQIAPTIEKCLADEVEYLRLQGTVICKSAALAAQQSMESLARFVPNPGITREERVPPISPLDVCQGPSDLSACLDPCFPFLRLED